MASKRTTAAQRREAEEAAKAELSVPSEQPQGDEQPQEVGILVIPGSDEEGRVGVVDVQLLGGVNVSQAEFFLELAITKIRSELGLPVRK